MTNLTLAQKIKCRFKKKYLDLEIRGDNFDKQGIKEYTQHVIESLQSTYPQFSVIKKKYSKELEMTRSIFLWTYGIGFSGYLVRIYSNIDPFQLKQSCIELETNREGERISDIDIYLPDNTKISRK